MSCTQMAVPHKGRGIGVPLLGCRCRMPLVGGVCAQGPTWVWPGHQGSSRVLCADVGGWVRGSWLLVASVLLRTEETAKSRTGSDLGEEALGDSGERS